MMEGVIFDKLNLPYSEIKQGLLYYPSALTKIEIKNILDELAINLQEAPLFTPKMPKTGKNFSVRMSNMGKLGWVTDQRDGYRYQDTHPVTRKNWPRRKKEESSKGNWRKKKKNISE